MATRVYTIRVKDEGLSPITGERVYSATCGERSKWLFRNGGGYVPLRETGGTPEWAVRMACQSVLLELAQDVRNEGFPLDTRVTFDVKW